MGFRCHSLIGLLAPMVALAQSPELLVNAQGWAQRDLSIRGSSYTGAGISINGLNLKAPYSAHFNSEVSFPEYLLSVPEARTGLENISGHLVGTAAYTTIPREAGGEASATIGTKEHYQSSLRGQTEVAGGFVDWEKARRIDSGGNDLDRHAGGVYLQTMENDWQLDLIGALQQKAFSTQGYFGVGTGRQTLEDSLLLMSTTKGELDGSFFRAGAALRQLDLNESDSRFTTAAIEGRTIEIQNISLNLRGDVEHEQIDGDIGNHDRTRGSVLILPQFTYEQFKITAGLNSVFQTDESAEWLPQAGIEWFATDNSTLYISYSEHVHQPDYQTLANNPTLQQQAVQNTELGFRQFLSAHLDWRAAAFHRQLENASDWIAGSATDLGTLNMGGLESEISFYPSDELELRAFYQWIHKDNDVKGGLYETDYPEHLLYVSAYWQLTPEFTLFIAQHLRQQTANATRTSSDFGADASVGLHWFPHFANNARLSFAVENLWDSDFQVIPGLKPAGQTVSTGITVAW